MSRLVDLMAECCPEGVEFRALSELVAYEQPGKYLVESTAYSDEFATPVLTAGKTFILGYTDEESGIYPASPEHPVVIFDDFTTACKWVDFPFKAKSSAMKMLTLKPGVDASLRYVWHAMQAIRYEPQDHARQWIGTYSRFKIPLPPLPIQREIAGALDELHRLMAKLEAELDAELNLRWLQHATYRQQVLDSISSAPTARIRDVVDFFNAKAHEKLVHPTGTVALMTARFVSRGEADRFVRPDDVLSPAYEGDVALVMSDLPNGRALARTFYVDADGKYAANQRVCLLRSRDPDRLRPRYLRCVMDRNPQLLAYNNGMDQTHLKKDHILDVRIPVPPAPEQERVVVILQRLDGLVKDLATELSSEIADRRKQYAYLRDKLLAFGESAA